MNQRWDWKRQIVFCFSSCHLQYALCLHKDGENASEEALATLLSSSDHSDIVTLDSKEPVHVEEEEEEEGAVSEELYLGTSCSSQYTFTAADTGGSLCLLI